MTFSGAPVRKESGTYKAQRRGDARGFFVRIRQINEVASSLHLLVRAATQVGGVVQERGCVNDTTIEGKSLYESVKEARLS